MGWLNNLGVTATNSAMISMAGGAARYLKAKWANGGRDSNCKFYYNDGVGGSILQVVTRTVANGAVNELKDLMQNGFNSLLNGKKQKGEDGVEWIKSIAEKQQKEAEEYGKMLTEGGTIYALDEWGVKCPEALMLAIDTPNNIRYTQTFPDYRNSAKTGWTSNSITNVVDTNLLVWYDTTALITINSDKNLISTRVTGRDYSRKELVSNGDVKFSVTGQISSGRPEVYPTQEIQKFRKVMQYKGIVKVNSEVLAQFGVTHIVITDFSLTPKEGYKSLIQYTFNAIGLQPEQETEITEDTINILSQKVVDTSDSETNEWMKMLENQLEGLKSMATDTISSGLGVATGLLDSVL